MLNGTAPGLSRLTVAANADLGTWIKRALAVYKAAKVIPRLKGARLTPDRVLERFAP